MHLLLPHQATHAAHASAGTILQLRSQRQLRRRAAWLLLPLLPLLPQQLLHPPLVTQGGSRAEARSGCRRWARAVAAKRRASRGRVGGGS